MPVATETYAFSREIWTQTMPTACDSCRKLESINRQLHNQLINEKKKLYFYQQGTCMDRSQINCFDFSQ